MVYIFLNIIKINYLEIESNSVEEIFIKWFLIIKLTLKGET